MGIKLASHKTEYHLKVLKDSDSKILFVTCENDIVYILKYKCDIQKFMVETQINIPNLQPISLFIISNKKFVIINKYNHIYIFNYNKDITYNIFDFGDERDKRIFKYGELKENSSEIILHGIFQDLTIKYIMLFDLESLKIIKEILRDIKIQKIISSNKNIYIFTINDKNNKNMEVWDSHLENNIINIPRRILISKASVLPDESICYVDADPNKYYINIYGDRCIRIEFDKQLDSLAILNNGKIICSSYSYRIVKKELSDIYILR